MKRILILLLANFGVKIITIIYGVLGSRLLGPELKGIYTLVIMLPSLYVSFFDFGIGQSSVYFYRRKIFGAKEIFSSLVIFTLLLSISVPIILIIFQPGIRMLFPLIEQNWIFFLSFVSYPFLLFQTYASVFVLAIGSVKKYSIVLFCKELITLILIGVLFALHLKSIELMFMIYMGTNVLSCLALFFMINKQGIFSIWSSSILVIKNLVGYGYKFNVLSIIQWIYYKASILIVGIFVLDAAALGIYAVACSIADIMFIISSSASNIIFIDEATERNNNDLLQFDKVRLNIKLLMLFMLVTGLLFVVIGYPTILLIYSIEYIDSYYPLVILIPGNIVFSIYKLYGSQIAASGRPELLIIISTIAMIGSIILNIIIVPIFGIIGAAFATSVSYVIAAVATITIYRRMKTCTCKEMLFLSRIELQYLIEIFKRKRSVLQWGK